VLGVLGVGVIWHTTSTVPPLIFAPQPMLVTALHTSAV